MAEEVYIKVKVDTKEAEGNVDDLNEGIKDTETSVKDVGSAADAMTGGFVGKFTGVIASVKKGIGAFKSLRVAIAATGLGALVLVLASLKAAFTGSEEGQNKFNKIMGVTGALVGNLVDLLADMGDAIIKAFENPKEALANFADAIRNNITTRIKGILNLLPSLGKAISLVFQGRFKEAGKTAADAVGQVVLGVDSVTESVQRAGEALVEFGKQNVKEAKEAAKVADMRAKADKIERELLIERSKLESEIAALRLKSRQEEEFSAEERKQALLDAQALEDSLLEKETEYLTLRAEAQTMENTFARSNKENLDAEAQAIAAVNRMQAARLNQQRSTQRELNRVNKEIERDRKAVEAEKAKAQKEADAAELKRKQELEKAKLEAEKKANDQRIAMEKAVQDSRKAVVQKGFEAIMALTQAFAGASEKSQRRAFEIQKRVQIAQTLMSTYQAITDAMAAKGGDALLPFPLRLANAVVAGVMGLANVKKIADTQFQSAGAAGGSVPVQQVSQAAQGGGAPSISTIGGTEQTQISALFNEQKPQRAYVTQDDINTNAALDRHVLQNATLGG